MCQTALDPVPAYSAKRSVTQLLTTHSRPEVDLFNLGETCRFCDVAGRETLICESEHATAFPSLGALLEGWVLIAPREHVIALSELDGDGWRDVALLADRVNMAIQAAYGPTVMFEHGAAGIHRTAGCGVDHAHLHIVPWTGNLREQIATTPDLPSFIWQRAGRRPGAREGKDYIWLHDHTGTWVTYDSELPSQVVRQAISNARAMTWWDWKHDLRMDISDATRNRLSLFT